MKVKLSEVSEIINGYAFKSSQFLNTGIPIVRIGNIIDDLVNLEDAKYYKKDTKLEPYKIFKHDILIAMSGATTGKIAYNKLDKELYLNQRIGLIRATNKTIPKYLFYFLKIEKDYLLSVASGSAQPNLSSTIIKNIKIPLPSIEQQKAIAQKLDKAQELIELRKNSIKKLDELSKALFIDMFGDPVENEMGWEVKNLNQLGISLQGGKNIGEDKDNIHGDKILKISSITLGVFNSSEFKFLPKGYNVPKNHYVQQGDLLMTRANTELLIGATAYVWNNHSKLVLPDKIWRFTYPENNSLNVIFHWKLFQTKTMRRKISQYASGTGGSMKNISKYKVLNLPIILPPLPLQEKFAKTIEKIEAQKALYEEELKGFEALFESLLSESFA